MKKVLLVAAVAMLALSSCKKSFECECTSLSTLEKSDKTGKGKTAEDACTDAQETSFGIPLELCVPK